MPLHSSMEEQESGTVIKRLSVPVGLEELMTGLAKEVLQKKPQDIYNFASEYFGQLLSLRDNGNYQPPPTKIDKQVEGEYGSRRSSSNSKKVLSRQVSVCEPYTNKSPSNKSGHDRRNKKSSGRKSNLQPVKEKSAPIVQSTPRNSNNKKGSTPLKQGKKGSKENKSADSERGSKLDKKENGKITDSSDKSTSKKKKTEENVDTEPTQEIAIDGANSKNTGEFGNKPSATGFVAIHGLQHSSELHDVMPIDGTDSKTNAPSAMESSTPPLQHSGEMHDTEDKPIVTDSVADVAAETEINAPDLSNVENTEAPDEQMEAKHKAATVIQAGVRGHLTRKQHKNEHQNKGEKPTSAKVFSKSPRDTAQDEMSKSKSVSEFPIDKTSTSLMGRSVSVTDSVISKTLEDEDDKLHYSVEDSESLQDHSEDLGIEIEKSTTRVAGDEQQLIPSISTEGMVLPEGEANNVTEHDEGVKTTNSVNGDVTEAEHLNETPTVYSVNVPTAENKDTTHRDDKDTNDAPKGDGHIENIKEGDDLQNNKEVQNLSNSSTGEGSAPNEITEQNKDAITENIGNNLQHSGEMHDAVIFDNSSVSNMDGKLSNQESENLEHSGEMHDTVLIESHEVKPDSVNVATKEETNLQHSGEMHDSVIPNSDADADNSCYPKVDINISNQAIEMVQLDESLKVNDGTDTSELVPTDITKKIGNDKPDEEVDSKVTEDATNQTKSLHTEQGHNINSPKLTETLEEVDGVIEGKTHDGTTFIQVADGREQLVSATTIDHLQTEIPDHTHSPAEQEKGSPTPNVQSHPTTAANGKLETIDNFQNSDVANAEDGRINDTISANGLKNNEKVDNIDVGGSNADNDKVSNEAAEQPNPIVTVTDVNDKETHETAVAEPNVEEIKKQDTSNENDNAQHIAEIPNTDETGNKEGVHSDSTDVVINSEQSGVMHDTVNSISAPLEQDDRINGLQHSGEMHDTIIDEDINTPSITTNEDEHERLGDTKKMSPTSSDAENLKDETSDEKSNVPSNLQHSSEMHDTVLITATTNAENGTKEANELQHSGEMHDTVVIPTTNSISLLPNEDYKQEKETIPIIVVDETSTDTLNTSVPYTKLSVQDDNSRDTDDLQHSEEMHDTVICDMHNKDTVQPTDCLDGSGNKLEHSGEMHDTILTESTRENEGTIETPSTDEISGDLQDQSNVLNQTGQEEHVGDPKLIGNLQHSSEMHDSIVSSVTPKEETDHDQNLADSLLHSGEMHDTMIPAASQEIGQTLEEAITNQDGHVNTDDTTEQHEGEHDALPDSTSQIELADNAKPIENLQGRGQTQEEEVGKQVGKEGLQHSGEMHDTVIPDASHNTVSVSSANSERAQHDKYNLQHSGEMHDTPVIELRTDTTAVPNTSTITLQHSGEMHDSVIPNSHASNHSSADGNVSNQTMDGSEHVDDSKVIDNQEIQGEEQPSTTNLEGKEEETLRNQMDDTLITEPPNASTTNDDTLIQVNKINAGNDSTNEGKSTVEIESKHINNIGSAHNLESISVNALPVEQAQSVGREVEDKLDAHVDIEEKSNHASALLLESNANEEPLQTQSKNLKTSATVKGEMANDGCSSVDANHKGIIDNVESQIIETDKDDPEFMSKQHPDLEENNNTELKNTSDANSENKGIGDTEEAQTSHDISEPHTEVRESTERIGEDGEQGEAKETHEIPTTFETSKLHGEVENSIKTADASINKEEESGGTEEIKENDSIDEISTTFDISKLRTEVQSAIKVTDVNTSEEEQIGSDEMKINDNVDATASTFDISKLRNEVENVTQSVDEPICKEEKIGENEINENGNISEISTTFDASKLHNEVEKATKAIDENTSKEGEENVGKHETMEDGNVSEIETTFDSSKLHNEVENAIKPLDESKSKVEEENVGKHETNGNNNVSEIATTFDSTKLHNEVENATKSVDGSKSIEKEENTGKNETNENGNISEISTTFDASKLRNEVENATKAVDENTSKEEEENVEKNETMENGNVSEIETTFDSSKLHNEVENVTTPVNESKSKEADGKNETNENENVSEIATTFNSSKLHNEAENATKPVNESKGKEEDGKNETNENGNVSASATTFDFSKLHNEVENATKPGDETKSKEEENDGEDETNKNGNVNEIVTTFDSSKLHNEVENATKPGDDTKSKEEEENVGKDETNENGNVNEIATTFDSSKLHNEVENATKPGDETRSKEEENVGKDETNENGNVNEIVTTFDSSKLRNEVENVTKSGDESKSKEEEENVGKDETNESDNVNEIATTFDSSKLHNEVENATKPGDETKSKEEENVVKDETNENGNVNEIVTTFDSSKLHNEVENATKPLDESKNNEDEESIGKNEANKNGNVSEILSTFDASKLRNEVENATKPVDENTSKEEEEDGTIKNSNVSEIATTFDSSKLRDEVENVTKLIETADVNTGTQKEEIGVAKENVNTQNSDVSAKGSTFEQIENITQNPETSTMDGKDGVCKEEIVPMVDVTTLHSKVKHNNDDDKTNGNHEEIGKVSSSFDIVQLHSEITNATKISECSATDMGNERTKVHVELPQSAAGRSDDNENGKSVEDDEMPPTYEMSQLHKENEYAAKMEESSKLMEHTTDEPIKANDETEVRPTDIQNAIVDANIEKNNGIENETEPNSLIVDFKENSVNAKEQQDDAENKLVANLETFSHTTFRAANEESSSNTCSTGAFLNENKNSTTFPENTQDLKLDENINKTPINESGSEHLALHANDKNEKEDRERSLSKNSSASNESASTVIYNPDQSNSKCRTNDSEADKLRSNAATTIQSNYRGYRERRSLMSSSSDRVSECANDEQHISPRPTGRRNSSLTEQSLGLVLDQQLALAVPHGVKTEHDPDAPVYIHIPLNGSPEKANVQQSSATENDTPKVKSTISPRHSNGTEEDAPKANSIISPKHSSETEEDTPKVEPIISPRTRSKNESTVEKALGEIFDQQFAVASPLAKFEGHKPKNGLNEPEYLYIPLKDPNDQESTTELESTRRVDSETPQDVSNLNAENGERENLNGQNDGGKSQDTKQEHGNNALYAYQFQDLRSHNDEESGVSTIIQTTHISDDALPLAVQLNQGPGQVFIIIIWNDVSTGNPQMPEQINGRVPNLF